MLLYIIKTCGHPHRCSVPFFVTSIRYLLCYLFIGSTITILVAWGLALAPSSSSWSKYWVPSSTLIGHLKRVEENRTLGYHYIELKYVMNRQRLENEPLNNLLSVKGQRMTIGRPMTRDYLITYYHIIPSEYATHLSMFGDILEPIDDNGKPSSIVAVIARGWPLIALKSELRLSAKEKNRIITVLGEKFWEQYEWQKIVLPKPYVWWGIEIPAKSKKPYVNDDVLPLYPVFVGFILDALLYACVVWIFIIIAKFAHRYYREVHGLCRACGYDIQDLDRCPECGKTTSK